MGLTSVIQTAPLIKKAVSYTHLIGNAEMPAAPIMGLVAFVFDTIGGVLVAKVYNLFAKQKINPMIGAAGISAFPMSCLLYTSRCV